MSCPHPETVEYPVVDEDGDLVRVDRRCPYCGRIVR